MQMENLKTKKICRHEGCGKPVFAKGWCSMHYQRNRNGQDMDAPRRINQINKPNFRDNIAPPNERGCELWTGVVLPSGYGQFYDENGIPWLAHRYQVAVEEGEEIPEGRVVKHTCFNKLCMTHLEIGTQKQNKNDPDCIGENHGGAKVPDRVQKAAVQFMKTIPDVTQKQMAEWLTNLGFKTARNTISYWLTGRSRSQNLD